MRIAVVGDIHGHWLEFQEVVQGLHSKTHLDLVLQVGDAQPIRGEEDLPFLPVPEKYRDLGNFSQISNPWPVPTWFIGGNHEPFNFLESIPEGGIVSGNLEYLGRASFREIGDLRVAALSGIYSQRHFETPRTPWPFNPSQSKQASYFRRKEIQQLASSGRVDILLLHEWPPQLEDARTAHWPKQWQTIGCAAVGELVRSLRPRLVVCGHMHYGVVHQAGRTTFIALDNFSVRPRESVKVITIDRELVEISS